MADLAKAVTGLSKLLLVLTNEAGGAGTVDWTIGGLDHGSATITAIPELIDPAGADAIPAVVRGNLEAAQQVRDGMPDRGARPACRLVREMSSLASADRVEVIFETEDAEVIFSAPATTATSEDHALPRTYGTVRGRVQTLQQRGGLRFSLYDLVHDKAVSCYLEAGTEATMLGAWGRLAEVSGLITRDPVSDRPLSVRRVSSVDVLDETDPLGFLKAEGVVKAAPGALPAEVILRRMRDAG